MVTSRPKIQCLHNKSWLLYILECSDSSLYTGITNRLSMRIAAHQSGDGARYTRSRLPVKLVYTEPCLNRSDASKREWVVKRMSKKEKLKLIELNDGWRAF